MVDDPLSPDCVNGSQSGAVRLVVSEIFGPTFQGEGPSLGRPCMFLRLGGCNQSCAWCDTPYTWDWTGRNGVRFDPRSELTAMTDDDIAGRLLEHPVGMLVVTGGEPMLQQERLARLLGGAGFDGWWIEVETAGTVVPVRALVERVDQFNVSLKLANSGNPREHRLQPAAIEALAGTGKAIWKFVVQHGGDLEEVDELLNEFALTPVCVMPEAVRSDELAVRLRAIAPAVLRRGWRLGTRLHIDLWGNRRGV